jgi:NAD+ kinase
MYFFELFFPLKLCNKLKTFDELKDDLTDRIDFIICLGGDGTLLYASSLFQKSVPPVMAFHLVNTPMVLDVDLKS